MYQLQCRAINRSNTILLENVRTIETQESGCKHDPSSITHTSVCFLWWWGYHSITNSYCRLHYMRVWCAQSFGTNPILLVSERCFLILILVLIIITVLTLVALVATPQTVCSPWVPLSLNESANAQWKGPDASIWKLNFVRYKRLYHQQTGSHPNETGLEIKVCLI